MTKPFATCTNCNAVVDYACLCDEPQLVERDTLDEAKAAVKAAEHSDE